MSTKESASFKCYRKTAHPSTAGGQGWRETEVCDTLNVFDNSEMRTPVLVLENHPQDSRLKIKEDGIFQTMGARGGARVRTSHTDGYGDKDERDSS